MVVPLPLHTIPLKKTAPIDNSRLENRFVPGQKSFWFTINILQIGLGAIRGFRHGS